MNRKFLKANLWTLSLLVALPFLYGCNSSNDDDTPDEPSEVTTLDLTITGDEVQCPAGNVYLFYCPDVNLSYATVDGDGSQWPLVDVSTPYKPVVKYKDKTIHPVSAYGNMSGGNLDTHSSVRYSQIRFNIKSLSKEYGTVGKNSEILVVVVLNDGQTKSWVHRAMQLRRDYLVHIYLPDNKDQTYVGNSVSAKWWQVEGEE